MGVVVGVKVVDANMVDRAGCSSLLCTPVGGCWGSVPAGRLDGGEGIGQMVARLHSELGMPFRVTLRW